MDNMVLLSRLFEALAESSRSRYVCVCDLKQNVAMMPKNAVKDFGLPTEIIFDIGKVLENYIHPDDLGRYRQSIEEVCSGNIDNYEMVYRARNIAGEYVVCSCRGKIIREDDNIPLYFVATIDNHSIAGDFDPVTGIYSKDKFLESLNDNIEEGQKYNVLFVGIRNFIEINNVYGYEFGNKVLKVFADHLMISMGDSEVFCVGCADFAIISSKASLSEMENTYRELEEYAKHKVKVDGIGVTLVLGGSYTEVNNNHMDASTIFTSGMKGLEDSMQKKHGELKVFSTSSLDKNREKLVLIDALRNSINDEYRGFNLLYQPVVDTYSEKIVGAEALVRWKKDPFGSVEPSNFVQWLEDDPIFYDLGLWIERTALKQWKENVLPKYPNLILSLNVSYTQLERKHFRRDFISILKEIDFPVENLSIELTERCKYLDQEFLKNEVAFFSSKGIKTLLDDFGTGFSALELLLTLPIVGIKLDAGFISGIEKDERRKNVIKGLVNCAADVGVTTTVEGIENMKMREVLRECSANFSQGFIYSMPIPINKFVDLTFF